MNITEKYGRSLSEQEKMVLREGGVNLDAKPPLEDPLVKTQREFEAQLADSLTPTEVAELLGMSESGIAERIRSREFYVIETEDGPRLPRFQFHDAQLLPALEELAPEIPPDLHPLEVIAFFTEPNLDFFINDDIDQTISPRDWLLRGEDPQLVALLLRRC